MEPGCLRHTEIPHTTRLFSDFQYHFDRVASFYRYRPGDPASYEQAAREVALPDERRAALVALLRARNGDSASLELLARPGTVAVVTGQQVGLFSGPAYTIYKALTAARLAADLTERGIPAVPIFWLATEDHDLAEVNHTFVFGADRRPISLSVDSDAGSLPDHPVGRIPIQAPPIEALKKALAPFPFAEEVTALVAEAYPSGVTFGAGFERLLARLLAKYGLLFIDPLDAGFRRLAAPVLASALRDRDHLTQRLLERNAELAAAGYHAQVHVEQKTSLVFLLEGDRRITLRRQNGDFLAKDRRYSANELIERAEHLSPNALLRPVVQDYVLPTVAYVGGPAELAYMAQSEVVYRDLLGRMPVMLSRSSFTLLDARAGKLMDRHGLLVPNLFHGEEAVREQIAEKLVPPALSQQFAEIQSATGQALDRLKADLTAFDSTLAAAADKVRAKVMYQLAKTERKAGREALKRDQRAEADAAYLSGLVYPDKHLQERLYSILPFLAEHGLPFLDNLYEHVHLDCPDHKVLVD